MSMFQSNFGKRVLMRLRTARADVRGNVAVIFALTMFPIFILMGFAIDLQQVTTSKSRVQHIVDSAVIGGAREMQDGKNDTQIRTYLVNYFKAAVEAAGNGLVCEDPLAAVSTGSQDISMDVDCYQKMAIMHLVGTQKIDFTVSSASTYGIGNVDIAFVFDISGSMGQNGKMDALKAAAEDALYVLLPDTTGTPSTGEVRIAMASYSTMVDAGDAYFTKVTNQSKYRTYSAPYEYETEEWVKECTWWKHGKCKNWEWVKHTQTHSGVTTKTVNNTCVKERLGSQAFTDADPGPNAWIEAAEAKYEQDWWGNWNWNVESCATMPPQALTGNRQTLLDYIDDLSPNGYTAGHLGIAWGWYLIAPEWDSVWPSASDPWKYDDPDTAKAMIIMTDGEFNNFYNPDEGVGNSFDQAKVICDGIKARGVKIYTVAFNAPTAGQQVLAYCSSGEEFEFKPDNAAELTEAYTSIAKAISDLRIKY